MQEKEKKISKDKVNFKESKLWKIIKHAFTYILGVLTTIIVLNYMNRPILSYDLRSLTISEKIDNTWMAALNFRIENSGKSSTSVTFLKCKLKFTESPVPIELKVDKICYIDEMLYVDDTVRIDFPDIFKSLKGTHPTLNYIQVDVNQISKRKSISIEKDTSKIYYSIYVGEEYHPEKEPEGVYYDTLLNEKRLPVSKYQIQYKGKIYNNFYYPLNAEVSHEIKDDKIYLTFAQGGKIISGNEDLFKQTQFFPHPKIADKIIYPEKQQLSLSFSNEKDDELSFENYDIFFGRDKRLFFYAFK